MIVQGRRASPIDLVSNLRSAVRDWREAFYIGASDTTIQLLNHWFDRAHRQITPNGEDFEFRYFFCQQEAIETLISLKEVRRIEILKTSHRASFTKLDKLFASLQHRVFRGEL